MKRLALFAAALALALPLGAASLKARVMDSSGQGVENAVVFVIEGLPNPVSAPSDAVMDQIGKEFVPHLLVVAVGARVSFPNKDNIHHHVFSFSPAKVFELPLYKGLPANPLLFDKPGVVKLGCNIHDWMSGIILVLPNAAFAVSDSQGLAEIPGLPESGLLSFAVFHERLLGSVDATRKPASMSELPQELQWRLGLRAEAKQGRHDFGYP